MMKPFAGHPAAAVLIGGLPFYLGALFGLFPERMSALFMLSGRSWPQLSRVLYSPKAMKVIGVFWVILGIAMWASILRTAP
jgi:hypothetical protein